jgi:hypothetical protein
MTKAISLVVCALLLVLTVTLTSPEAVADTQSSCAPIGESQDFIFSVWGESQHWALILQGLGTCKEGRIYTAKTLPYLVWAGGAQIPKRFKVTFTVQNLRCVQGTVEMQQPTKVVRVADCKLVYPGQGLLVAKRPEDLVRAITSEGKFEITWDGMTEQITWRYGYPPPTRDR